jgi:hypothetical protein
MAEVIAPSAAAGGATAMPRLHLWIARVIATILVLFFLMDATIHILRPAPVVEAMDHLGFPLAFSPVLGVIELVCLALWLLPRSSVLGAVLLTGILGGAVTAHARVGDAAFPTVIFPVLVGLLLWGPLYLRESRLRALFPWRRVE